MSGQVIKAGVGISPADVPGLVARLGYGSTQEYQEFFEFDLVADGIAGDKTAAHLASRFCSCVDNVGRDPEKASWPRSCMEKSVSYWFDQISGVSAAEVATAWKMVKGKFNRMSGAQIRAIVSGDQSGEIWATDGPLNGSTLAWSFLPNGDCADRIEQRYDTSNRNWNLEMLAKVILHEIGHAYGLEHSNREDDIMYPSLSNRPWGDYPSANDVDRMQRFYGEPPVDPDPDPDPDPDDPTGKSITPQVRAFAGTVRDACEKLLTDTKEGEATNGGLFPG